MSNIVLAEPLTGTVTASTAAAGRPGSNVLVQAPKKIWESVAEVSGAWIQVDFGAPVTINLVAPLFSSFTSVGTFKVMADDTAANLPLTPAYDSGDITLWAGSEGGHARPHGLLWLGAAPETYRHWRIQLDDATNTNGMLQMGRLVFANAFQPDFTIERGWTLADSDSASGEETRGGTIVTRSGSRRRVWSFTLGDLTADEFWTNLWALRERLSGADEMLIIMDPAADARRMKKMFYGLLKMPQPSINKHFNRYRQGFRLTELI